MWLILFKNLTTQSSTSSSGTLRKIPIIESPEKKGKAFLLFAIEFRMLTAKM